MYVIHINNIKICIFSSCYRRGRQRDSPWPQKHMPGCDLPQEPTWKGAERPMMTVSREGGGGTASSTRRRSLEEEFPQNALMRTQCS